jgi:hypothetical protein
MELDPVVKIALWQRCGMGQSDQLASRERTESLSLEEAENLGLATFTKVALARDTAHQHGACKCCSKDATTT